MPTKTVRSDRVRCALVGLGRIGMTHFEAMQVPGAELVAIAEPREAVARPFAEERRLRWFADACDPELAGLIDAVVVATPPSTHPELVRHFLGRDVHVLCEKPLAIGSVEARGMLDLARQRGLELMMASKFRYVSDLIEAKAQVEGGSIGSPLVFENTFSGKVPMKDRWNAEKSIAGGGVLIDNGTHSADIARYLLGPLTEVQALVGPSVQGLAVEDTARLFFRSASGAIGTADLTWSLAKETESYVAVYGTTGTILVGWKGSRCRQEGGAGWVPFGAGYQKVGCLRAQFENFLDVLRGRAAPLITADDALASVQVIEAAYESSSRSAWVPVGGRP